MQEVIIFKTFTGEKAMHHHSTSSFFKTSQNPNRETSHPQNHSSNQSQKSRKSKCSNLSHSHPTPQPYTIQENALGMHHPRTLCRNESPPNHPPHALPSHPILLFFEA
jgi:hypothetical protein